MTHPNTQFETEQAASGNADRRSPLPANYAHSPKLVSGTHPRLEPGDRCGTSPTTTQSPAATRRASPEDRGIQAAAHRLWRRPWGSA